MIWSECPWRWASPIGHTWKSPPKGFAKGITSLWESTHPAANARERNSLPGSVAGSSAVGGVIGACSCVRTEAGDNRVHGAARVELSAHLVQ